ncbi:hypothetical protein B2G69_08170 [Methylorubrum zatmanii]|nr:hypothetical protein [Methylorubrum zatmanii]ARO54124.1 hypothetical protein B2G69_08170 [Methylorubrum zatmanii]
MSRGKSLATDVWIRPKPETVALLLSREDGMIAARERWHWCSVTVLLELAAEGRQTLGLARPARGSRPLKTPGLADAVVAAVERLASVPAAAVETGLSQDSVRRVLRQRGLPIPRVDRVTAARRAAEVRRQRSAA